MTIKHLDYCTHMKFEEDRDILTRRLFDVNMRLFESNFSYRELVRRVCAHIAYSSKIEKEGYKKPHGWSGANAGIPWNIIAVNIDNKQLVMINPKITGARGGVRKVLSNCGSLTLEKPRTVTRTVEVEVEWFDPIDGKARKQWFGPTPGFTVQHEIQHNLGILITSLE